MAPHSEGTRTVVYESRRFSPNLFTNIRCIVHSLRFLEKEAVTNVCRKRERESEVPRSGTGWKTKEMMRIRELGRTVFDPCMLTFIKGRYEFRMACLLSYAPAAQSLIMSGFEKQLRLECVDFRMRCRVGALRALLNSLNIVQFLADVPKDVCPRLKWIEIRAFYTTMVWKIAGHLWPALCSAVLEVLFDRTFQGMPLGVKADTLHPFSEPPNINIVVANQRSERVALAFKDTLGILRESLSRLLAWAQSLLLRASGVLGFSCRWRRRQSMQHYRQRPETSRLWAAPRRR
jgi:hypothetical protein